MSVDICKESHYISDKRDDEFERVSERERGRERERDRENELFLMFILNKEIKIKTSILL